MSEEQPTVKVALTSIHRRLVQNGHDGIFLEVKARDGDITSREGIAAVEAALRWANESVPPESVWCDGVSLSPRGVMVNLASIGTEEETAAWLAEFARRLELAGWSGSVGPAPVTWLPQWLQAIRSPRITGHAAYRLARPPSAEGSGTRDLARWGVAPEITESLCRAAVGWGRFDGADVYFEEGRSSVALRTLDATRELGTAARRSGTAAVTYVRKSPLLVRRVSLDYHGEVTYQLHDPSMDWPARLDQVRALLVRDARELDLAAVRLSPNWALGLYDLGGVAPKPPYVHYSRFLKARHLWGQFVPDAFGVQIVTADHVAKASSLAEWDVDEVAAGRFLVQSRDLAAWYAGEEPDQAAVVQARADFGGAIMTDEIALQP